MNNTSLEFRNLLNSMNTKKFFGKTDITLADTTVLNILNSGLWQGGIQITEQTSSSGKFTIGKASCAEAIVKLYNMNGQYSDCNFYDAVVRPYEGLQLSGGIEYVKKGVFTVDNPKTVGSYIVLTCMDNMHKLDKKIATLTGSTAGEVASNIAMACGVFLKNALFDGYNKSVTLPSNITDYTYRQMLEFVLQITGNFARCDEDGLIDIRWYNTSAFDIGYDGGNGGYYYAKDGVSSQVVGVKGTNLVANGDFSGGTTGWIHYANYSQESVAGNTLTSTKNAVCPYFGQQLAIQIPNGHKVYIKTSMKANRNSTFQYAFDNGGFGYGDAGMSSPINITTSFTDISTIITSTKIVKWIAYACNNYGVTGDNVSIKYPIILDLTAIFGAGKEPTASQIDTMLSQYPNSYFNGTNLLTTDPQYTPNYPSVTYPSPITANITAKTYKYTSDSGIYEFALASDLRSVGSVADKIVFNKYNNKGYVHRNIGYIASYSGQPITTAYKSTTGALTTGATVIYVLTDAIRTDIAITKVASSTAEEISASQVTDLSTLPYVYSRDLYHVFASLRGTPDIGTDDVVITGIKVTYDDETYQYGEDGYVLEIKDNPLTQGRTQEIATDIGQKMVGIRMRPLSINSLFNPIVEVGDVGYTVDRKKNVYQFILTNFQSTIGQGLKVGNDATTPQQNEFSGNSTDTVTLIKAKKETEKQIGIYDLVVKQLTDLISNGFGMFKTEVVDSGGGTIFYMHDKPLMTDSSIRWYMTTGGIIEQNKVDGVWVTVSGTDKHGNALYQYLTARGINVDEILLTGKIKSADGKSYLDLTNNKFVLGTDKLVFDGTNLSINGKMAVTTATYDDDIISITSTDTVRPTKMKMSSSRLSTGIDYTSYSGLNLIKNAITSGYFGVSVEKNLYKKSDNSFIGGYGIGLRNDIPWEDNALNMSIMTYKIAPYADGIENIPTATINPNTGDIWTSGNVNIGESSIAPNGYTKLTNGLIMQWGQITASATSPGDIFATAVYPISFPNACLHGSFSLAGTAYTPAIYAHGSSGLGKSSLSMSAYSGQVQQVVFYWFAIGY